MFQQKEEAPRVLPAHRQLKLLKDWLQQRVQQQAQLRRRVVQSPDSKEFRLSPLRLMAASGAESAFDEVAEKLVELAEPQVDDFDEEIEID